MLNFFGKVRRFDSSATLHDYFDYAYTHINNFKTPLLTLTRSTPKKEKKNKINKQKKAHHMNPTRGMGTAE